ncbi:RNA ligase- DRB0094 family [Apiospora arundinis]
MPNRMATFIYVIQNDSVWAKALERRPAVGRGVLPHARMGVCGETQDFRDNGKSTLWESLERMNVPTTLGQLTKGNFAIEGVIWVTRAVTTTQGRRPHHQFKIFAVWDIDQQKRLTLEKTHEFAKWLGLLMVPDLGQWGLSEIVAGEAARADLGVVYMSMDGQTVMASRAKKDASKLKRTSMFSPW